MHWLRTSFAEWLQPIRGRIMTAFVLIVGLYFVLSFGEQAWRSQELNAEVEQRRSEIAELREERDQLEAQLNEYGSERYEPYVEQIARRDLNLAYPGETVMLVRWTPAAEEAAVEQDRQEQPDPPPNWRRWFDVFS